MSCSVRNGRFYSAQLLRQGTKPWKRRPKQHRHCCHVLRAAPGVPVLSCSINYLLSEFSEYDGHNRRIRWVSKWDVLSSVLLRRTNCSHLCQTHALFRNNIECFIYLRQKQHEQTLMKKPLQFFFVQSVLLMLHFVLLLCCKPAGVFGPSGRSVIICGFSFYLRTRPRVLTLVWDLWPVRQRQ